MAYLDPPFNSNASYNVLFAEHDGRRASSQLKAFDDTWEWNDESARSYRDVVEGGGKIADALSAMFTLLKDSNMMAYLAMMAPRLVELHRVLNQRGSIYLHCDPTASHYLKLLMDAIFGAQNFRNEIVWKRSHAHSDGRQGAKHFGRVTDTLLFYSKSSEPVWNPQFAPYDPQYVARDYRRIDDQGRRYRIDNLQGPGGAAKGNPRYEVLGVTRYWRYSKERMARLLEEGRIIQTRPGAVPQYKRYLDEMPGVPVQNLWADLPVLNNRSREVLGYPTQKPQALLDRIIATSSNEGDVVLDAFCGCGTAIASAHMLKRRWIGIDITQAAIVVIKQRFRDQFGVETPCEVIGEPVTEADARVLADSDPYQFQWWSLGLVGARPAEGKKGADQGVDGRRYFVDPVTSVTHAIVFSVKAGQLQPAHVRDLHGVVTREKAAMGVLLTMEKPTPGMRAEAASAGTVNTSWGTYPRLQIRTVSELLEGKSLNAPPARQIDITHKRAPRSIEPTNPTGDLFELRSETPNRTPRQLPMQLPMAKAAIDRQRRKAKKSS